MANVRKGSLANPLHLMRYMRYQALPGSREERLAELARMEKVKVDAVRDSINKIEIYRGTTDQAAMDFAVRDIVISAAPKAKETIIGLMSATELVEITDHRTNKKRVIRQPDKTTRIEGVRLMNDLIGKVQPKQPLVEVNNTQTNQIANISAAETMEERLARLRKQAQEHNLLPPEVAAVPVHVDQDVEMDDDEEEDDEEEEE